ncbi:MAG: acetylxylan esterase [Rikenellaceae bacterium]
MKNLTLIIVSLFFSGCAVNLAALKDVTYSVPETGGWLYISPQKPVIDVVIYNKGVAKASDKIKLVLFTDKGSELKNFSKKISVPAGDSSIVSFSFNAAPGFYRTEISSESGEIKKFNIGLDPEKIISPPDSQPDFKNFWDRARAELATVAPGYELTYLKDSSSDTRRVYLVKMRSLEDAEISGYYVTPVKPGKYPAIIGYMGYGSKPWCPNPDNNPEFVEFVLSVRGQALQEATNIYGDWITYNLQDKEKYYYRGAFMDLIRAIDFVASREEVDTSYIFAEGGSQGGAFTLAACALDNRICAAAPFIPFLSDYPDYFGIVHWPAEPILAKQKELGIPDAELYKTLSYFDIKNLAGWIKAPVIMGFGLQDEVCPPHTNFAGYNLVTSKKSYICFPDKGHDVGAGWWQKRMDFFSQFLKTQY